MTFSRKNERGQAIVLAVLALTVLLGMAALVLDVGEWFRTKRRLQGTADAAALAGAQKLPEDPSAARALAMSYANDNGGNVSAGDIQVGPTNDTISVKAERTDPGFFSGVLGIGGPHIDARAKARVGPPVKALHVAPMVVSCQHQLIHHCNDGDPDPDFGDQHPTTMDYDPMGAPGAYGMLNLDGGSGTPGSSDEAEWILHGFNKYLGLGDYRSDPGAKFSSSNIQDALTERRGDELLFPVFRTLDDQGQNATYEIIGWIGFHLDTFEVHGNNAVLHGYFTEFIAQGILAGSGNGDDGTPASSSFGVKSIQLIE
jgi:secretion/DNA translocation related TadE-like protein